MLVSIIMGQSVSINQIYRPRQCPKHFSIVTKMDVEESSKVVELEGRIRGNDKNSSQSSVKLAPLLADDPLSHNYLYATQV